MDLNRLLNFFQSLKAFYGRWIKGTPKQICPHCGQPITGKSVVNFDSKTQEIKTYKEHQLCRPNPPT